jgi:hypothetical protein
MDFPRIVAFNPTVDTNIYANGDVLFDTAVISNLAFDKNRAFVIDSVMAMEKSDNPGLILDLYFLDANVAMGTFNGAPSISDANALNILGVASFAAADWKDLGGVKVALKNNLGIVVKPATDTSDVYAAAVLGAVTPTFGAASDFYLRIGCKRW